MIQREAAERFAGGPCSRETRSSLLLKPWWQIEIVRRFRRTDFDPPPSVDAVALWLARRTRPLVDRFQAADYRRFIQSCFGRDGRSIRWCLRSEFTRTQIYRLSRNLGFDPSGPLQRPHLRPVARIVQVPEADAIVSSESHDAGSQSSIAFPSGSWMRAKRPIPSISLSWLTSISADFSCVIIASRSATRKFSMKVLSAAK